MPSPGGDDRKANFGVVMGVLGAMALVGVLVVITVPLVRYRKRRGLIGAARKAEGEVESAQSRRSSLRHQKMSMPAGPDALLPLIHPASTFTWSDLRSKDSSADSIATSTHHAATSYRHSPMPSPPDSNEMREDILGGAVSRMSLSPPSRSPTPPGLSSTLDANTAVGPSSRSFHTSTASLKAESHRPLSSSMYPLSPISPTMNASDTSRNPSRAKAAVPRSSMEPVFESSANRVSRPRPRQLPSPPASPDQFQGHWQSRRRPTLTGVQSSSTTLPFRPRSSTVSSQPPPITSMFQTSLLQAASRPSTATSTTQRYPTIVTSNVASRSRASSVSTQVNPPPQPDRDRPGDDARRMSTASVRQHSFLATETGTPRAYLRTPGAQRTPLLHEPDSSSHSPMATRGRASTVTTPPSAPLSPLSPARPPDREAPRTQPSNIIWKQPSQPHQQQPALVRRKDSLALRPLPASAFALSPPHTRHNRTPSDTAARMRSHSVMSQRSLPAHIPPLDPLPTLNLDHGFSGNDTSESQERPPS
ncbi:hypothetical protein B0H21DRAFT_743450 [Amylocystis lapponica]|nr:hypothetical protein B0H21DRAFT_743450 [Amylocystis lapponica]